MIILFILWWLMIVGAFVGGILIVYFDGNLAGIPLSIIGGGLITLSIAALMGLLDKYV